MIEEEINRFAHGMAAHLIGPPGEPIVILEEFRDTMVHRIGQFMLLHLKWKKMEAELRDQLFELESWNDGITTELDDFGKDQFLTAAKQEIQARMRSTRHDLEMVRRWLRYGE